MGGSNHGGIYIERVLYKSEAFLALKGAAPKILILFLDKREREPKNKAKDKKGNRRAPQYTNLKKITLTYKELEAYGYSRSTITRALDELLAKGFIEIMSRGGAYRQDKTVYALCVDYQRWKRRRTPPIHTRRKDVRRGYQGKPVGVLAGQNETNAQN